MGTSWNPAPGAGDAQRRLSLVNGFGLAVGHRSVALSLAHQRLVAFLGLQPGPVTRPRVAATLWPERPEGRAGANLRSLLF
ncbi:MAG: hypothetical protein M3144_03030, partial [Actinomycetota bacterium]|nr:hypothetical protein [Actinomycetota bacterium]